MDNSASINNLFSITEALDKRLSALEANDQTEASTAILEQLIERVEALEDKSEFERRLDSLEAQTGNLEAKKLLEAKATPPKECEYCKPDGMNKCLKYEQVLIKRDGKYFIVGTKHYPTEIYKCPMCNRDLRNEDEAKLPIETPPKEPLYTPAQLEILNALYTLGWRKAQYDKIHCTWYLLSDTQRGCSLYYAFGQDSQYEKIKEIFTHSQSEMFDIAKAVKP